MRSLSKLQRPDLLAVPIAALLRDAIFDWELRPGERIIERRLAAQWNVSRAPLREAIKQLTSEGLIVVSPHRGASVRGVSEKELIELFEVRELIEVHAVKIAARVATEGDLHRLWKLVAAMQVAAARHDLRTFRAKGFEFHDELVHASASETLVQIYDGIKLRFRRYQLLLASLPNLPESSAAEHEEILAALSRRDGEAAGKCVARHLAHLVTRFVERDRNFLSTMVDHRPAASEPGI